MNCIFLYNVMFNVKIYFDGLKLLLIQFLNTPLPFNTKTEVIVMQRGKKWDSSEFSDNLSSVLSSMCSILTKEMFNILSKVVKGGKRTPPQLNVSNNEFTIVWFFRVFLEGGGFCNERSKHICYNCLLEFVLNQEKLIIFQMLQSK